MKNFLAVIGGIVVGFFVLMIIVYVSNNANTPGGISLFGNEAPVHSTPRPQTATQIANRITASMEKSSPGEFSSEYDELESLYKVSMWSGYTQKEIETLQSGLGLDRWDSSCEQIIGLCDDMQHIFDNNGHPEVTVVLSLVDPEDHDTVFATAARGVIGYDVVKGIDLKNKSET